MLAPTLSSAQDSSASIWWSLFAATLAVLLIPLLLTEIPPLLDYPNHLARMEILAHGADDPALSRIYRIDWRIVPNIGIDLAMPLLMRILPLAAAGKIFVGLALALPIVGVTALHRALFRRRSYWPLAAALVAYNRLFFAGFLNFLIGVGLALVAAAVWEELKERKAWVRVATAFVAAIVIFFCHLIALAFYGLLLASLELARARRLGRLDAGRVLSLFVPFVVPAILYLNAPISQGQPEGGHGLFAAIRHYYWALAASPHGLKLYGLAGPFLTYNRELDAVAIILVVAFLAWTAFRRQLKIAPAPAGAFVLLLAAYPVVPFFLMETAWVDQRIPILCGFLLFAGTMPTLRSRYSARALATVAAAVIILRVAEIALVWSGHDAVLADFRNVIAPVAPGDRVLVVQAERNTGPGAMVNNPDSVRAMRDNDSTMHLPALLVIERRAFWPLLFTAPTKQPVRVLSPYDAISLPEGELPWAGGLADLDPDTLKFAPYLIGWEHKFDWVLILHPAEAPDGYAFLPDRLEPAAAGGIAALYRVRR